MGPGPCLNSGDPRSTRSGRRTHPASSVWHCPGDRSSAFKRGLKAFQGGHKHVLVKAGFGPAWTERIPMQTKLARCLAVAPKSRTRSFVERDFRSTRDESRDLELCESCSARRIDSQLAVPHHRGEFFTRELGQKCCSPACSNCNAPQPAPEQIVGVVEEATRQASQHATLAGVGHGR